MSEDQEDEVIELLSRGFGVEDIALKLDLLVAEIRELVGQLRADGLLRMIFQKSY